MVGSGMQRGDPLVVGRVIGDVVDPFVRRVALRVGYASRDVANGCELRPSAIADPPRVEVGGPDMRTFYTLLGRQTVYAPGWRQNFSTRDFAELYNLGLPVAAVYFNCQRETGTGGRRM
ncbi:hypothetical protein TRIUR3_21691 [Triticum urartu]|uniref:Uncharacterized protein n=2 Tax=Triticum TaxID=4564 RepID=A0A9R0VJ24_TRITD|nr:hypothetical protein TRIUR3_21691 [Triticum urartu]VAH58990.1 unnamed protein product [Triticum turgidum subsp. durum]